MGKPDAPQLLRLIVAIALLLVLFALGAYLFSAGRDGMQTYEARSAQYAASLEQLEERADTRFYDFWQIVSIVENNADLRPIAIADGGDPAWITARDELKNLLMANRLLYDIGLYYRDEQFMITSSGLYRLEALRDVYYRYASLRTDEMLAILQGLDNASGRVPYIHGMDSVYRAKNVPSSVFTLFYPVPASSLQPYATLVLQMDGKLLASLLGEFQLGEISLIADKEGRVLAGSEGVALPETLPLGEEAVELDGTEYRLFQTNSKRLPVSYCLLVPSGFLDGAFVLDQTQQYLLLGLVVALLLAVAFALARWVYSPMRSLVRGVAANAQAGRLFVDERRVIQERLDALSHRVSENIAVVRETALTRLVARRYESLAEVLEICRQVDLTFSRPSFRVALLRADFEPPPRSIRTALAECHIVRDSRAETLLCVLCADGEAPREVWEAPFAALGRRLEGAPLSVGKRVDDFGLLRESYWDASDALDQMLYRGETGLRYAEDVARPRPAATYPVDALYKLKLCVLGRDFAGIAAALRALRDYVEIPETGAMVAQLAVKDACGILNDRFDLPDRYTDITEEGPPAAARLSALLSSYAETIIAYEEAPEPGETPLIENVLLYIEEHLEDASFSIRTVAAAFGMKESAFSQMFKRRMDRNYIGYINELKIQRAQGLLLSSDMTIEEIAARLGYSTSSNFSRMFKTAVQLTPSQFRQYAKANA